MLQEGDGQGIMKRQRQTNRSLQQACLAKTVCAILLVFVQSSVFVTALVGQAGAQMSRTEEMDFNIPAQPVGPAVNVFANATGWQVSFPTDLVAGFTSPGINGQFTPEAALRALLAGTGLRYQFADTHAVTLVRESPPSQQDLVPIAAKPVVVTGELQQRTVQESQTSVAIARGEVLDQSTQITNIKDIYNQTANVNNSFGGIGVSVRGVEVRGQGGGRAGLLVNVNVDGATYLTTETVSTGAYSTWDLGQVEILRGPQSSQRGRNALAGAVLIRSHDPAFEEEVKTRFDYGRFNEYRAAGAANLPLIDDRLALRVSGEQFGTDGFINNPTRGEDDYYRRELQTLRGKLRWRPIDQVDVILGHTFSDNLIGIPEVNADATGTAMVSLANDPARDVSSNNITNLRINYDANPQWSLYSETTYYNAESVKLADLDATAAPVGVGEVLVDETSITQEVRAIYRGENLSGTAGVYYTDAETDTKFDVTAPFPGATLTSAGQQVFDIRNIAVFGEVEMNLSALANVLSNWTVIAGARFDYESQDDRNSASTTLNPPIMVFPPSPPTEATTDFSAFLPKGGVIYHWTDQVSTGFTIQRGYRAGGSGLNSVGQTFQFDAEFTWNYELAFRSTWLDKRLVANANVFYTDWTDQQVNINGPNGTVDFTTENAGSSELYGFELETQWQATKNLNVFANLGHVFTRFTDFILSGVQLRGNEFRFAPRWTGSFGGAYYFDNGFVIDGNANFTDSVFADATNNPLSKSDSFLVVNGRVGYETGAWAFYLWGRNIFDNRYFVNKQAAGPFDVLGEPAIYGFTITGNFEGLGDIVNLGS